MHHKLPRDSVCLFSIFYCSESPRRDLFLDMLYSLNCCISSILILST